MTSLPPQPLSPLDGRYFAAVGSLADYLSEAGLNRARVEVEVEWLLALTDRSLFGSSPLTDAEKNDLRALYRDFGQAEIDWLAEKEAVLAEHPDIAFTTPHFNGYPAVLVRLDRIDEPLLTEIVTSAWLAVAPQKLVAEFDANRADG